VAWLMTGSLGVYVDFDIDIEELMMCIEIISFGWEFPRTKAGQKAEQT
jgi:hypothetical protein